MSPSGSTPTMWAPPIESLESLQNDLSCATNRFYVCQTPLQELKVLEVYPMKTPRPMQIYIILKPEPGLGLAMTEPP